MLLNLTKCHWKLRAVWIEKRSMSQNLRINLLQFSYINYISRVILMEAFSWLFFTVHDEPREIQLWVANVNASSFISMAVRGHSLYRLNYPLAMKKWHHMCTSWNGKTGEWQLWVSSERVGRGFYNRVSIWFLLSFYEALKIQLTLNPSERALTRVKYF